MVAFAEFILNFIKEIYIMTKSLCFLPLLIMQMDKWDLL